MNTDIEGKYPILKKLCDFFNFPLYTFTATVKDKGQVQGKFRSLTIKSDSELKHYIWKQFNKQKMSVSDIQVELVK